MKPVAFQMVDFSSWSKHDTKWRGFKVPLQSPHLIMGIRGYELSSICNNGVRVTNLYTYQHKYIYFHTKMRISNLSYNLRVIIRELSLLIICFCLLLQTRQMHFTDQTQHFHDKITYFVQTNSCTLFKTHSHSHLKL